MANDFAADALPGELYGPALLIESQEEADAYLARLVARVRQVSGMSKEEALALERDNLGYFAGNADHAVRQRVERLFGARHPVLGTAMRAPVAPEEALNAGISLALARQGRLH